MFLKEANYAVGNVLMDLLNFSYRNTVLFKPVGHELSHRKVIRRTPLGRRLRAEHGSQRCSSLHREWNFFQCRNRTFTAFSFREFSLALFGEIWKWPSSQWANSLLPEFSSDRVGELLFWFCLLLLSFFKADLGKWDSSFRDHVFAWIQAKAKTITLFSARVLDSAN